MSSIWGIINPIKTGKIKLLSSGRQLYGTVIKHGVNDKTITVRVSSNRKWSKKYSLRLPTHKNKQVHDEDNFCVTGDQVIIANCEKLSPTKAYYVKRIVKPYARPLSETDKQYIGIKGQSKEDPKKEVV